MFVTDLIESILDKDKVDSKITGIPEKKIKIKKLNVEKIKFCFFS